MPPQRSPYRLGPVDEPRLLRARRHEISRLLDIVAPTAKSVVAV
jgi:hypothetical protein